MSCRPKLLAIGIVLVVQISLCGAVVRGIDGTAILGAGVGPATVSEVRSEDQNVA